MSTTPASFPPNDDPVVPGESTGRCDNPVVECCWEVRLLDCDPTDESLVLSLSVRTWIRASIILSVRAYQRKEEGGSSGREGRREQRRKGGKGGGEEAGWLTF